MSGQLSIGKSSSYFDFKSLAIGSLGSPSVTLNFLADTLPMMANPPKYAQDLPLWYTVPQPCVLTIAPSAKQLQALNLVSPGVVSFYYKVKLFSEAQNPLFFEGSFGVDPKGNAAEVDSADGSPLPIAGIKLYLPRFAVSATVFVEGSGHASATQWANTVMVGAQLCPVEGAKSENKVRQDVATNTNQRAAFIPRFAHTLTVPTPDAVVGATVVFRNLSRDPVGVYPIGDRPVPVPPTAVMLTSVTGGLTAGYDCY